MTRQRDIEHPAAARVREYLAATGWDCYPQPRGDDVWRHPGFGDYPDDGISFPGEVTTTDRWDLYVDGITETLGDFEGRCQHEVLAELLGESGIAALLARIDTLERDLDALAAVGRLYIDCLDADPENEMLTLGGALRLTEVRNAVDRCERRYAAEAES